MLREDGWAPPVKIGAISGYLSQVAHGYAHGHGMHGSWWLAVWKLAACGEEGSGARHGIGGECMQWEDRRVL